MADKVTLRRQAVLTWQVFARSPERIDYPSYVPPMTPEVRRDFRVSCLLIPVMAAVLSAPVFIDEGAAWGLMGFIGLMVMGIIVHIVTCWALLRELERRESK